jgi:hypothetical protein
MSARDQIIEEARKRSGDNAAAEAWLDVLGGPAYNWPKHWCGAFALLCLHLAGLALDWRWRPGVGFLYRLPRTSDPQPGDIAYFAKAQHHAIVVEVRGETLYTIDGNSGPLAGGRVVENARPVAAAAAFYSIAPLLSEAQQEDPPPQPAGPPVRALRLGDEGPPVKELRALLMAVAADEGATFGPYLDAMVRAYQRSRGLKLDGVVGAETWASLKA